jgi:hypothetical protein
VYLLTIHLVCFTTADLNPATSVRIFKCLHSIGPSVVSGALYISFYLRVPTTISSPSCRASWSMLLCSVISISLYAGPSTKTTQNSLRCWGECCFGLYSFSHVCHIFVCLTTQKGYFSYISSTSKSNFRGPFIVPLSALQILQLQLSRNLSPVSVLRRTISQCSKARLTRILPPLRTTFQQRKKHFGRLLHRSYSNKHGLAVVFIPDQTSANQFSGFGEGFVVPAVGHFSLFAFQLTLRRRRRGVIRLSMPQRA